jgi:mannose-6-phosphate isomerase-like protein (cupin superfamily)
VINIFLILANNMYRVNKQTVSKRERKGLISHFLLGQQEISDTQLSITWVEVAPGARQRLHHHAPEQVYVIVRGQGRMQVGAEEQIVATGDLVYIPPHAEHGIINVQDEPLVYISAATPTFDHSELYDQGQLRPENY